MRTATIHSSVESEKVLILSEDPGSSESTRATGVELSCSSTRL